MIMGFDIASRSLTASSVTQVAVAVNAIIFTLLGKILLNSPSEANAMQNSSPLHTIAIGKYQRLNHTDHSILTTF